jgi:DNA-binding LacI/PurR family transcriptional regulator
VAEARTRVGLLTSSIATGYFRSVWEGAVCAAAEGDFDLVAFVGSEFDVPTGYDAQGAAVFDLAGPRNLDAAVVMAANLGRFTGGDPVLELCRRVGVPVMAVGAPLDGVPHLLVDNTNGIIDIVTHLVEVHGRRKIAFIRGPKTNEEAELRYAAYCGAIEACGIDFDKSLVVGGRFDSASAMLAVRKLLDRRGVAFDAIVAANDRMALGAMAALEVRGMRIPEDVAVAGFDDLHMSIDASPPLTTVRQPSYELGRRAVAAAAALARGEDVPPAEVLDVSVAVRASCGCQMWPEDTLQTGGGALREGRDRMVFELARPSLMCVGERAATRLVDSFVSEMNGGSSGSFADVLKGLVANRRLEGQRAVALRDGLALFKRETIAAASAQVLPLARNIWRSIRPQEVALEQRARAHERTEEWRSQRVREIGWDLASSFCVPGVVRDAARLLPEIGISTLCVNLFETGEASPAARVLLACDANGKIAVADDERVFPRRQLLPAPMLRPAERRVLVVHPLYVRRRQMGYVVFQAGPLDGHVYENLARHLSIALRGAQLADENMHSP